MLVTGFPAGAFAANCYLVAPAPGEECVIIDPGQDAERGIEELLGRYRLKPIAVLLTHGHIDHMWSVAPVCGAKGVPAYIHPEDRELLADPGKGMSLHGRAAASRRHDVQRAGRRPGAGRRRDRHPGRAWTSRSAIRRAIRRARSPSAASEDDLDALFTGDLLFAGSIGRTDLPGGDHATILKSLARTLTLPDETIVLPGHGPQTTIGDERAANPFLTGLQPAQKGL